MKKLLVSLVCFLSFLGFITIASAKEKVNVYIFTKDGCSHCEEALQYFNQLSSDNEYKDKFNLITLQVFDGNWNISNQDYYDILMDVSDKLKTPYEGTPYIIVGETVFDGFTTKYEEEIEKEIDHCYEDGYTDPISNIDDYQAAPEEEHTGIKIFINILSIAIIGGVVAGLVITRLPKNKKANIKENKERGPRVKLNSKIKSNDTNKPKQKK